MREGQQKKKCFDFDPSYKTGSKQLKFQLKHWNEPLIISYDSQL